MIGYELILISWFSIRVTNMKKKNQSDYYFNECLEKHILKEEVLDQQNMVMPL